MSIVFIRRLLPAVLIAAHFLTASADAATRVLFVGNSFTYGHTELRSYGSGTVTDLNGTKSGGVPGIFKRMCVEAGLDYDVSTETVAGQTLGFHAVEREAALRKGQWDIVVIQGLSTEPLPKSHGGNPANFFAGAAVLRSIFPPPTKMILYETWASPTGVSAGKYRAGLDGLGDMQDDLTRGSFKAAYDQQLDGVARVGTAFLRAIAQHAARVDVDGPDSAGPYLWFKGDRRHAGVPGSYLSAAVLFGKITGHDPRDLKSDESSAAGSLKINAENAKAFHRIASEVNGLPALAAMAMTTCLPIKAASFDEGHVVSLTTAEGTFDKLTQATAGPLKVETPLAQNTRFFIVAGKAAGDMPVSLVNADGATVGSFCRSFKPTDLMPIEGEAAGKGPHPSAVSFSLSDLGVADLAKVREVTGLRIDGLPTKEAIVGTYTAAEPAAGSIFLIGSGPPKSAPKPATAPKRSATTVPSR